MTQSDRGEVVYFVGGPYDGRKVAYPERPEHIAVHVMEQMGPDAEPTISKGVYTSAGKPVVGLWPYRWKAMNDET